MFGFGWCVPAKGGDPFGDPSLPLQRRETRQEQPSSPFPAGDGGAHEEAADTLSHWAGDTDTVLGFIPTAEPPDKEPAGQKVGLGGEDHTVGKGDSLWSIAERVYGNGKYWTKIKAANPGKVHGDEQIIYDGDTLVVPELEVPTLEAMRGLEKDPERLRDMATSMSDEDMKGFVDTLSDKDREKYAALIQKTEMMRATGMTPDELAEDQKKWLEEEAAAKGISVGELIKQRVSKTGYGGEEPKVWNGLSPSEKAEYHDKFQKLIKKIEATAPPDVKRIIELAKKHGGSFVWDPEDVESNKAFAYTNGDWSLHLGQRFIDVAEGDPSIVYANIMHEMGGHNIYGKETGFGIQTEAMNKLPTEEKQKAESGGHSVFSSYGYMETEIFAELYEYKYDSPKNPTDHPFSKDPAGNDVTDPKNPRRADDVMHQLQGIKEAFSPEAAKAVVAGLAVRVRMDKNITPEAKAKFDQAVEDVLGAGP